MPRRTLLLDTSSLAYRAFFALPTSIRDPKDRPVNLLHGYLDFTATLVNEHKPDAVVHCFDDDWRPAPRVAIYAGYKSKRLPDPEGLPEQFPVLREVLRAAGMTAADAIGWEAEDAIGSIAAKGARGERFEIVTGDRDLIQLVRDPVIKVLFTRRGVTDLELFDEAGVLARYGVPASRYADFAILRGDPSDSLPGVRGVGEKTARILVNEYPTLAALLDDAEAERRTRPSLQRSASLRAAIREARPYVEAMEEIVPIRTDLELAMTPGELDEEALARLGAERRLASPIRRLRAALAGAGLGPPAPDAEPDGAEGGAAPAKKTAARRARPPGSSRSRGRGTGAGRRPAG